MARPAENLSLNSSETLALFAGNANPALAHDVAKHLSTPFAPLPEPRGPSTESPPSRFALRRGKPGYTSPVAS